MPDSTFLHQAPTLHAPKDISLLVDAVAGGPCASSGSAQDGSMARAEPGKRILCVEHDPEAAASIADELAGRGFDVEVAHFGADALARILREAPDLVLSEIRIPVMTGFELLRRLRAVSPRSARIPFVFLAAPPDHGARVACARLGCACVSKPIDVDQLVAILETRLARATRTELWLRDVALSEREVETLTWAARGKTSAEIALIVGLSKRTVDFHIDNARNKLGVATRIEAAAKAASGRLIEV